MIWVAFYVVVGFFAFYIFSPFFERAFRKRTLVTGMTAQENLRLRKEEIFSALNDLEYDYKMKKMAEPDYEQLKETMTREAIDVMKKLDQPGESAGRHEAERNRKVRS